MNKVIGKSMGLALLAFLWLPAAGSVAAAEPGQGYGQGQQQPPKQPTPPTQPGQTTPAQPAAPAVNAAEEATYKAFFELKGNEFQQQIQLGEEFLKKYPESRYRGAVYSRLAQAYLSAQQLDKLYAAGEKALELNPDNVDVLSLIAWVLPRRYNPNELDAAQKLQKTETYSKRAIELLTNLKKPEGFSEEDFARAKNDKLSMCHSALGFVHFHRQKYAESAGEFEEATKMSPNPDPTDFYVLGLAYHQTKHFGDAAAAFGRCGEAPGPLQETCKKNQEEAKKRAATELAPPK